MLPHTNAPIITAAKGLEQTTLLRMSQIVAESVPHVAVLSGPTFAREVAAQKPTALVAASSDPSLAAAVQSAFSCPTLRVYTSPDRIGVEIGGALKNVVAIGAGVCDGLNLGHNAVAALITRGLAEITRLAVALGALPQTLSGLAGLGDLVLTCTGSQSRNHHVGLELARGKSIAEITASMKMVAEGVNTTHSAVALAARHAVDLPIALEMDAVLHSRRSPAQAIQRLMERTVRQE